MKHYRNQPQATSHVYRSVLLRKTGAPAAKDEKASDTVNKFICFKQQFFDNQNITEKQHIIEFHKFVGQNHNATNSNKVSSDFHY